MLKFTDENGEERCLNELVSLEMKKGQSVMLYEDIKDDYMNYSAPHIFVIIGITNHGVGVNDENGKFIVIPHHYIIDYNFYDAKALIKFQAEWIEAQKKLI